MFMAPPRVALNANKPRATCGATGSSGVAASITGECGDEVGAVADAGGPIDGRALVSSTGRSTARTVVVDPDDFVAAPGASAEPFAD
ncbi:MAG: hypothetical protein ACF8PN_13785 [Phycisphaerales bacterium]